MPEAKAPLGILFVHGIGAQRKGETLASFGGALYRWLDLAKDRAGDGAATVRLADARLVVPEDPAAPAHARMTLNSGEKDAADVEWLLAESWWAESFGSPSFKDLAEWGLGIIPWTIGSHFGAHVQAVWSDRGKSNRRIDQIAWGLRFARSILGLVASLFLSLVALAAFAVMLVVALVPVTSLRRWLGGVQRALAASLGDSYTLIVRPLEGASIVGQVRRDLEWLSTRCETLVVVAHSQGAAVSFQALDGTRPANLALLFTFGSGLRKLLELKEIVSHGRRFKRAAALTLLGAVLTPLFATGLVRLVIVGQSDVSDPWFVPMLLAEGIVSAGLLLFGLFDFVQGFGKDVTLKAAETLAHTGVRWVDCYSAADPVPNGPTFGVETQMPAEAAGAPAQFSIEACNQRSVIADHTFYWSNLDEFVSLFVAALQYAGGRGVPVSAADGTWLAVIRRRRWWRVNFLLAIRWAAGAAIVATLIRNYADWSKAAQWTLVSGGRWLSEAVGLAIPVAAQARPDLAFVTGISILIGVTYMAARLAWRRWDAIEQRDLVGHFNPKGGEIALAMALAAQAALVTGIAFGSSTPALGVWVAMLVGLPMLHGITKPKLPEAAQPRPADAGRYPATDLVLKIAGGVVLPLVMMVFVVQMVRDLVGRLGGLLIRFEPYLPRPWVAVASGVGALLVLVLLRWVFRRTPR